MLKLIDYSPYCYSLITVALYDQGTLVLLDYVTNDINY